MKKSEFKALFIAELTTKGIGIDAKQVESALSKTGRHAAAKYGSVDWQMEHDESDVRNAIYFYGEYKSESTFNRERYQQSRKKND